VTSTAPRLTELANLAGCTAKVGAGDLDEVIRGLTNGFAPGARPENLIVGLEVPDDAAVYRLDEDRAMVLTVDFFAPIVDDPYAYGQISAANALSDVYAMGAEVAIALNILGVPFELDPRTTQAILRGGADKVAEAGGLIVGGHTVIDPEPKYGLCVVGFVDPSKIATKGGARPGDRLLLTKPLGTGLITTAHKFEECDEAHLDAAIASMSCLNAEASRLARAAGAVAMTDVTGFGLLGHAHEMATAGGVSIRLSAGQLPLLPGAEEYAYRGVVTGGGERNRQHLDGRVDISGEVSRELEHLLYDPQTSGGLLFALPPAAAQQAEREFAAAGAPVWCIGEVEAGEGIVVDG
jgi:selenide,water dikinase